MTDSHKADTFMSGSSQAYPPINGGERPANGKAKTQDARSEILHQAKILFRQKGYSAVSMNDLVSAIGLTKPTIYYHFTDKETLFAEVVMEMMRHGNELFTVGIKRCKDTQEKLTRLAEGYFRFSPVSLSTMIRDASEHLSSAHLKRVMDAHAFYLIKPLEAVFEDGMQSGSIAKDESPEELAIYFISWIDAMTMLKSGYGERQFDPREASKRLVSIFLFGLKEKNSNSTCVSEPS